MSVFANYSKYYNLLYKDKDYEAEAKYIETLIKKSSVNAKTILELGCGTGKHAKILSGEGFKVHGIDLSETMLNEAYKLQNENLTFEQGDVRTFSTDNMFDVVISLFHVINYQITNEDLISYFKTAHKHLKPGGVFIFDCWYGPAVLAERPESRVKEIENSEIKVIRKAEPVLYPNKNAVDVNYDIEITDKKSGNIEKISETHKVRYLFKPEILMFMELCGFKYLNSEEWLTSKEPGFDTWGVCFACEKI